MIIIYEDEVLTEAPDNLVRNDFITVNNRVYKIMERNYVAQDDKLVASVVLIKEDIDYSFCEMLVEIYDDSHFKTSGLNTNEIANNPKTMELFAIATAAVNSDHLRENIRRYRDNVINNWKLIRIPWEDIFDDNPPLKTTDIKTIKIIAQAALKSRKTAAPSVLR